MTTKKTKQKEKMNLDMNLSPEEIEAYQKLTPEEVEDAMAEGFRNLLKQKAGTKTSEPKQNEITRLYELKFAVPGVYLEIGAVTKEGFDYIYNKALQFKELNKTNSKREYIN